MSDLIRVVDLEVWSCLGVPSGERAKPQRLLVTLDMQVASLAEAAASDDLARTVDYAIIAQAVKKLAETRPRQLLETLAEDIARDLFTTFPVQQLDIEIKKFILPDAAFVSVKIRRAASAA